jgi:AcrR family transcriptional regulator
MNDNFDNMNNALDRGGAGDRAMRSDAKRNLDALLQAAKDVFATSGVDAPVREIAEKAGVGVGTVYRHFPNRADLIAAVFRREIDSCADAAPILAAEHEPFRALREWIGQYTTFFSTKRGLASALHSGNPAFVTLPDYFQQRYQPALKMLLDAAIASGDIVAEVDADDLLRAIGRLCTSDNDIRPGHAERMVALLVSGLRRR